MWDHPHLLTSPQRIEIGSQRAKREAEERFAFRFEALAAFTGVVPGSYRPQPDLRLWLGFKQAHDLWAGLAPGCPAVVCFCLSAGSQTGMALTNPESIPGTGHGAL